VAYTAHAYTRVLSTYIFMHNQTDVGAFARNSARATNNEPLTR